ncbi:MAG: macro domain-containing protein [Planctomycetes bacterium]|nr:macro domain-containing protein [Planctomycetota bacterium]
MALRIVFVSRDEALLREIDRLILKHPDDVEKSEGSVLESGCDAILCPTNSLGFLDGGLALEICERFGFRLQEELRALIRDEHDGELLVGQARILPTGIESPRWIIFAPVARTPQDIHRTVNVFLAMRAALLAIRDFNRGAETPIASLAVPPLAQGDLGVSPFAERRQVRHAIDRFVKGKPAKYHNLSKAVRREKKLKRQEPKSKSAAPEPVEAPPARSRPAGPVDPDDEDDEED